MFLGTNTFLFCLAVGLLCGVYLVNEVRNIFHTSYNRWWFFLTCLVTVVVATVLYQAIITVVATFILFVFLTLTFFVFRVIESIRGHKR